MFNPTLSACVCLIRHGETDWNARGQIQGREDTDLNATGQRQAEITGRYLSQWSWDALIASPLKRAWDTATIIANHTRLPLVHSQAEFMERDYGACAGLTSQERRLRFPDGQIPGQEPLAELQQRILQGLQAVQQLEAKRVLIVTHGGVINALLAHLSAGTLGTGKSVLHNASLTLIEAQGNSWQLWQHNYSAHLQAPLAAPSAPAYLERTAVVQQRRALAR